MGTEPRVKNTFDIVDTPLLFDYFGISSRALEALWTPYGNGVVLTDNALEKPFGPYFLISDNRIQSGYDLDGNAIAEPLFEFRGFSNGFYYAAAALNAPYGVEKGHLDRYLSSVRYYTNTAHKIQTVVRATLEGSGLYSGDLHRVNAQLFVIHATNK